MNTEKFTPGEWKVVERWYDFAKVSMYHIQWSKDDEEVAERIYTKADAHLMAASKELYFALKELVGNCRPGWQEVNVSRETIDKALNALKKARGEE
jgi:hypothetical protein